MSQVETYMAAWYEFDEEFDKVASCARAIDI